MVVFAYADAYFNNQPYAFSYKHCELAAVPFAVYSFLTIFLFFVVGGAQGDLQSERGQLLVEVRGRRRGGGRRKLYVAGVCTGGLSHRLKFKFKESA